MAKVVDKLEAAYKKGEYDKFLKKIGQQWKEHDFLQDEKLPMYVFSCYHEGRPRKLREILKKICKSGDGSEVVIDLLQVALIDGRDAVIESVVKISEEYGFSRTNLLVNIEIIKAIISRKRTIKYFTTERTGELISKTLNQDDFYFLEESEDVLLGLKNRARKLYRSKNFTRVIAWFEDVECRERNFNSYRFLLLSLWGSKDIKRCRDFSREALRKLELPENTEVVLDILYTISDFPGIIDGFSRSKIESMSFGGRFILARTLRKMGEVGKAENMIRDSKIQLAEKIESEEIGVSSAIRDIKQIGILGDVDTSESLLHTLVSSSFYSNSIEKNGVALEFADLVRDTLDRQKTLRVSDVIVVAEVLMESGDFERALSEISRLIKHGITDSTKLLELYVISANKSGKRDLVLELIGEIGKDMEPATVERMAFVLEREMMFREFRLLCKKVSVEASDSLKFIRSYFNIMEKDSGAIEPSEILIKISKKNKPNPNSVVYFIERYAKHSSPSEIQVLLDTLRIGKVTRIYCSLRILELGGDAGFLNSIAEELSGLSLEESRDKLFLRMLEEFCNLCHREQKEEHVVNIIRHFALDSEYRPKLTSLYIRSLISLSEKEEALEKIDEFKDEFSNVERWRFLISIGNISTVEKEIDDLLLPENVATDSRVEGADSILFKIGKFREYLDSTTQRILTGIFSISDLTKHYFSLFKIGEDKVCISRHKFLKDRFAQEPEKRAILAIVGYDFGIEQEYMEELELATLATSESFRIPLMISKEFIKLERVDVAFFYIKKALKLGQNDQSVIRIGRMIQQMMYDLEISPSRISISQITDSPIYSDAEVIRGLMKFANGGTNLSKSKKKKVAVHSHTLDIGGAERQASLLINCLHSGKIENSSFALITNKIPGPSDREITYYRDIPGDIEIHEYFRPMSKNKSLPLIGDIIGHMSITKANRLRKMVEIYTKGEFDVVHTWQDYCNVYGGIAALISGADSVIMSARTLPPPDKGKLASRQGRSYGECYRILLNSERVVLTHNSDFGNNSYVKWLGISKDKSVTVHNGMDVQKWKDGASSLGVREHLGIGEGCRIVGTVGRLTTDKRPWLFLKVAELLLNGPDIPESNDLKRWYEINEGAQEESRFSGKFDSIRSGLHFVMVGDGPQLERARQIVENSNSLSGRVHLVGFSKDVGSFLTEFDCFLLTSRVEGLPNAVIEAQAFGLPVVSTDAGGASECFIDGETGLLASNDSPDLIGERLVNILNDRDFSTNAQNKGLAFVEEKFGLESYSQKISKLYYNDR